MLHLPLAAQHATDDPAAAVVRRQLAAIGSLVAKAGKVVVVSGAGVSCSCGIPDFRSADGLYNLVKARYPSTVVQGKDLFSSGLFRSPESTSLFFSFIAELKAAVDLVEPSRTHRFVRRLEERGKLARSYTQNIDGLERRAGVRCSSTLPAPFAVKAEGPSATSSEPSLATTSAWSSSLSSQASSRSPSPPPSSNPTASTSTAVSPAANSVPSSPAPPAALPVGTRIPPPELDKRSTKNVQLHGDIHALRCTVCAASYAFSSEWVELYKEGECVNCPACEDRVGQRVARGQRALSQGVLRPGIVLYDENHPSGDLIGSLQSYDIQRAPDLLLVLGTSLKVHGLKRLVKELAKAVHSLPATKLRPEGGKGRVIFVNKTAPGKEWDGVFDAWVEGDCDDWVDGVEREWRRVRGRDFEAQSTLAGLGKAVKPAAAAAAVAGKSKAKAAVGSKAKKEAEALASAPSAGPSGTPRAIPAPLVTKRSATLLSTRPSSSTLSPSIAKASRPLSAAPRPLAPTPSSPLPMLSSPASAPAHVLSPAQRAVNVPAYLAPLAPPTAFSVRQAEGSKSPKKRQRLAGETGKGKGRAYSDDSDDDENSDDDILLVEQDDITGAVKLSPLGRFAALPSIGASSTPRRLPPPQFESRGPTPGSLHATPRAALPSTANGARKRPPGTPVTQSPFMVRPAPAKLVLASAVLTKGAAGSAGRALGRAETANARDGVLEAAGVVPCGPVGRPRRRVAIEVIEVD